MNKIGIVYFSGTGNTEFVAQNMKLALEKQDNQVNLINVEKDSIDLSDYNCIIIGGPVYVERYPEILLQYVENNLRNFRGKCMLFTTQGTNQATTTFQHAINRLTFLNITYCEFVLMPNNFFNFMFKEYTKEEAAKCIMESSAIVEGAVNEFLAGKTKFYPMNHFKVIMINMVYNLFYPIGVKFFNKKIAIDTDKCVNCKLCERNCPVNSIKITDKVSFNNSCLMCQRCMSNCPRDAFIYKNKQFVQYKPLFKESTYKEKKSS